MRCARWLRPRHAANWRRRTEPDYFRLFHRHLGLADEKAMAMLVGAGQSLGGGLAGKQPLAPAVAVGQLGDVAAAALLARILDQRRLAFRAEDDGDVAGLDARTAQLRSAILRLVGAGAALRRVDAANIAGRRLNSICPSAFAGTVWLPAYVCGSQANIASIATNNVRASMKNFPPVQTWMRPAGSIRSASLSNVGVPDMAASTTNHTVTFWPPTTPDWPRRRIRAVKIDRWTALLCSQSCVKTFPRGRSLPAPAQASN